MAPTSYELLHNFVWTSPQIRTNFASTSQELLHDFVWTLPQIRTNFT